MKKVVSLLLALLLMGMLFFPVNAEENNDYYMVTSKGVLTYGINNEPVQISDGSWRDAFTILSCDPSVHIKECTLPWMIDGYIITGIANHAFKDCNMLTSVKILEDVTHIGDNAFEGCIGLTAIYIPASMTNIGYGAFSTCARLTDVYYAGTEEQKLAMTIEGGNEDLLNATWHCDYSYERPWRPDDLTGKSGPLTYAVNEDGASCAINHCDASVTGTYEIPSEIDGYTVTSIQESAFSECNALESVVIPETVEYIDDGAFYACETLTNAVIKGNVSSFMETFGKSLKSVTLPESIKQINSRMFFECSNLTDVYYGGSEAQRNSIVIEEENENLLKATWHYNSNGPIDYEFTVGKDDFSFLNNQNFFFTEKEQNSAKQNKGLASNFFNQNSNSSGKMDYSIPEEAYRRLTQGMSNVDKMIVTIQEGKKWTGACYAMARVAAIRYLDKDRLPLSKINTNLSDEDTTFDLKPPVKDPDVKNLINYYHLEQFLPQNKNITKKCKKRIEEDYQGAIDDIVSAIKEYGCVHVSLTASKEQKKVLHGLLLVGIGKVTPSCTEVKVWDPNTTEISNLYMYSDKGKIKDGIRISTDTYRDNFDKLYRWFIGIEETDPKNYFGEDNAQETSGDESASIRLSNTMSVSFVSGDAELNIVDGAVQSSKNVSAPYYDEASSETSDSDMTFYIEKQYLGDNISCTVSNNSDQNELMIVSDGWSVSVVSDKATQIEMDNTTQSVKLQMEEKGLLSACLTQNTPSAGGVWYGTAVDVNDAKELALTPTSEGVKVSSDNMQEAFMAVKGEDKLFSSAVNSGKNEILIQETDEDENSIRMQGLHTIMASSGEHGSISPMGNVALEKGRNQTFTFTPDDGYVVDDVKVDGESLGKKTDYTLESGDADKTIEVTFKEKSASDAKSGSEKKHTSIIDWILSVINSIKQWFEQNILAR